MLILEAWMEALRTLQRNGVRSLVTATSMTWGMFMLVVLLGVSTGLRNGAEYSFRYEAVNCFWAYGGQATLPFEGTRLGKRVDLDIGDLEAIERSIPEVEEITGRFYPGAEFSVVVDGRRAYFEVLGVHPGFAAVEHTILKRGRFLNRIDLEKQRKVAVIGIEVARHFFGESDPIGKTLTIDRMHFHIAGVFDDLGGEGQLRTIYIPLTTAQLLYNGGRLVHEIIFTVPEMSVERSQGVVHRLRALLAKRHHVAPDDLGALRTSNGIEEAARVRVAMNGIRVFTWLVGLGTLIAAVVGVGNIMLISVQERTREIGTRRAIGASVGSVVRMVLRESVLLTVIAGWGGIAAGTAVLDLAAYHLPANEMFRDPAVDWVTLLWVHGVLLTAGLVAGWLPARRAARMRPAEALRA